jgi:replicative superfamily II helicase
VEILFFLLGITFILVSLFLTYRQEKLRGKDEITEFIQINRKFKKREEELNGIIKEVDSKFSKISDELEEKQFEIEKLLNELKTSRQQEDNFIKTLESELSKTDNQNNKQRINSVGRLKAAPNSDNYQQIASLFSKGLSFEEIAQKLGLGQREVELIWKFNNRGEN